LFAVVNTVIKIWVLSIKDGNLFNGCNTVRFWYSTLLNGRSNAIYASILSFVYAVTNIRSRQTLLVVVLLITIGINVMFILDTNRRLQEETPTTGSPAYRLKNPRKKTEGLIT
jgi:hypothetical protein